MQQFSAIEAAKRDVDFVARISDCETNYDLLRLVRKFGNSYGFEYFMVGRLPGPEEKALSALQIIGNWPPELVSRYDAMEYLDQSTILHAARKSSRPIIWSVERAKAEVPGQQMKEYYDLLDEYGLTEGVVIPVQQASGQRGAVVFAGARRPPSQPELMAISFFANLVYERVAELTRGDKDQTLSNRERECLYWTANGKTSQDIAAILTLSEHTVNHYLSAACQKLGAVNRTHAVAKAIRSGILD